MMATDDESAGGTADAGRYLSKLFGLDGRVAVVTGATSGLGAAVAEGLADAGAHVVVVGRDRARGTEIVNRIAARGCSASLELADVGKPAEVSGLIDRIIGANERVDILINSAGTCISKPALDTTPQDWDAVFDVNVKATFLMCQGIGRHMIARGSGKIVNFASTDGFLGVPDLVAYTASKGAVVQITRSLAVEWIKYGVNVNCVAPTEFATPMIEPLLQTQSYQSWLTDAIPIGRVGQPEELVGAVLFLVAPSSAMVVGHTVFIDGGRTVI